MWRAKKPRYSIEYTLSTAAKFEVNNESAAARRLALETQNPLPRGHWSDLVASSIDDAQIVPIHLQAYPHLSSRNAR